jgi:hypothetical protein
MAKPDWKPIQMAVPIDIYEFAEMEFPALFIS